MAPTPSARESRLPSIVRLYEQSTLPQFPVVESTYKDWRKRNPTDPEEEFWVHLHVLIEMADEPGLDFEHDVLRHVFNKSTRAGLKRKLNDVLAPVPTVQDALRLIIADLTQVVYEDCNLPVPGIDAELRAVLEAIINRGLESLRASVVMHEDCLCDWALSLGAFVESVVLFRFLHKHPEYLADYKKHSLIRAYIIHKRYMAQYVLVNVYSQGEFDKRMEEQRAGLIAEGIEFDSAGDPTTRTQRYDWDSMARDALDKDNVFQAQAHLRFLALMELRNDVAHTRWSCLNSFARLNRSTNVIDNSWELRPHRSMHTYALLALHEYCEALHIIRPYLPPTLSLYCYMLYKHYEREG